MPRIKLNGFNINYRIKGNGHPLVFIHGGRLELSSWRDQVTYFSRRYRVVTYDIRGHGKSDSPPEGYGMGDCVDDLHELLHYLAMERAYLAGLSMGGYIALSFTLTYPDMVDALILTGTNSGPVIESLRKKVEGKLAEAASNPSDSADRLLKAHLANIARPDITSRLSEIRKPTLIIVGDRDTSTPRYISEVMSKRIVDSRMVALAGCGHRCNEERPNLFNSLVDDFLKTIELA